MIELQEKLKDFKPSMIREEIEGIESEIALLNNEIIFLESLIEVYKPMFLSGCKSYEDEVRELVELIEGEPADIKLLKSEYVQLTGKNYRRRKQK